jgi:tetratricopeptide (TPR) repeat protein
MPEQNAYRILNIRKGAAEKEIKQAYVDLVKKYDPELHTERFMVIQQAYEKLRDPKRRAREDIFTYNFVRGEFSFSQEERTDKPDAEIRQQVKILEEKLRDNLKDDETKRLLIHCYMQLSWKSVHKKLWAEAIQQWVNVLNLDPTHLRAKNNIIYSYITLGYSYAMHGLNAEAVDYWEKALQMNPDNPDIVHNLAIACEQNGDKTRAEKYWAATLKHWKFLLDQNPDDEYIKHCIVELHKHHGGKALDVSKDSKSALDEYREILKITPNDFDAHYQIAATFMEEQKWDEAVEELKNLNRLHAKNIEVMNLLGWALLNGGQVDAAFTTWRKALAVDPKNYSTKDNIIRAHLSLGKKLRENGLYTPALVHFKALLKYLPKSAEIHFEIGTTYLMKADYRSALNEFNVVLELDPRNKLAKKAISEMKLRR